MKGQAHDVRWLLAVNEGSQEIPPFGVVEIVGVEHEYQNEVVLKVQRPTSDNPDLFAVNGWQPIDINGYGSVSLSGPVYVAYDTSETPAFGEEWGPQENSFLAKQGSMGLFSFGPTTIGDAKSTKIVLVDILRGGSRFYIGKVSTAAIDSEDTGEVTQYNQLWEITDPAVTFTVLNPHDIQLPLDLKVRWTKYPGWADWIVEPWHWTECPEEEPEA